MAAVPRKLSTGRRDGKSARSAATLSKTGSYLLNFSKNA
jgi:hypothetical protein